MKAFISRTQTLDSDFTRLLQAQGWEVHGQSLVTLEALPFDAVPDVDWMFFASKNAVAFFFQHLKKQRIAVPRVKWAALGDATAASLAVYVATIDFIGNGEPEYSARAFQEEARTGANIRVLFPAARHSMQSIAALLQPPFQALHLEVYDNQPIANPVQRMEDVLVFTSPMNAQTYFSRFGLLPFQRVVAIGPTTAEALRELGIASVRTAVAPNERSLAEAAVASV